MDTSRRLAAEFLGTFWLVLGGCGSALMSGAFPQYGIGITGVSLAFGLTVVTMAYGVGHISGAHFNPAVTLAFAVTRHFDWRHVPAYWLGQFAGAISAAISLWLLFGPVARLGANRPAGSAWQAVGLEVLLTVALMFVITAVATDAGATGQLAAVAIGGTVALNSLTGKASIWP